MDALSLHRALAASGTHGKEATKEIIDAARKPKTCKKRMYCYLFDFYNNNLIMYFIFN